MDKKPLSRGEKIFYGLAALVIVAGVVFVALWIYVDTVSR